MFKKARLKLTFWYLLIIMIVSVSFSGVIYYGASRELGRIVRLEQYRSQHPVLGIITLPPPDLDNIPQVKQPDVQVIQAEKERIIESLVTLNLFILLASALCGYFLAGRTLRPIAEMVDEQNRFITDASHELNTPLTALKTSIEVNLRDKALNTPKAKKLLQSNLEDVNNLQLLSGELIKLSQYQKANGNLFFEKVSLGKLVNQAMLKVKPLAQKKKIKLTTKVANVSLMCEEKSVVELFVILLDNAVKYSNNGSEVNLRSRKYDSKVEITVEDKGIGIAKEDLPHIFDRFYRSEKSRTKQKFTGYGLGLSIAKRVVSLHKGTINVESELGKGTKFTMVFNTV